MLRKGEPPSADPHARWCGREPGAIRVPIPIDMVTGSCITVSSEVLAAQSYVPDEASLSVGSGLGKLSSAMIAHVRFLDSVIVVSLCFNRPRIDSANDRASYELDRQNPDRATIPRNLLESRHQQKGNSESSNGRNHRVRPMCFPSVNAPCRTSVNCMVPSASLRRG